MAKKICMTLSFPFPGKTGTPLHAMEVASGLKGNGLNLFVVQFTGWKEVKLKKDIWNDIPIYRIPFWLWLVSFIYILLKEKPDVIHAQHVGGAVNSLIPSKLLKVPLVYEAHSFWIEEADILNTKKGIMFYKDVIGEKLVFKLCSFIIVMSEKMKKTFIERYNIKIDKTELIYPGANFSKFADIKDPDLKIPGVSEQDQIVMYTGNFWPWQGIDILLNSVPDVLVEHPNAKFVLIGGSEDQIKDKKEKYNKFKDNIIFLGTKPHSLMSSYLRKADTLVIPRPNYVINWTTPRKMGEYLTAGKPLIATDVGDHKLLIEKNGCGYVTEVNHKSFAEGINKALKLTDVQKVEIGIATKKVLNEKLSMEKNVKLYANLYKRMV